MVIDRQKLCYRRALCVRLLGFCDFLPPHCGQRWEVPLTGKERHMFLLAVSCAGVALQKSVLLVSLLGEGGALFVGVWSN